MTTLIRRKFTDDGDMQLNNFIDESEATMQATATRLRMFLSEFFLNLGDGTDYWGSVFAKPLNIGRAELELKSRILKTVGVKELTFFKLSYDSSTRKLTLNFEAIDEWNNAVTNDDIKGINPITIG